MAETTNRDAQVIRVPLEQIRASRYQKRRLTADRVKPLAETIRKAGLLQPVTVRSVEAGYELIAGHRRWLAFTLLRDEGGSSSSAWSHIPCIVRRPRSELEVASLTALENLERDDGDPLEQALSMLEVKTAGGFETNGQVAEAVGLSVQRVTRLIRLAEAPACIHAAVSPGVFVERADGPEEGGPRRQHVRLEPSVALAVLPFWRVHVREEGPKVAAEKTTRLLDRIARGRWTRARIERHVRGVTGVGTSDDDAEVQPDKALEVSGSPPARRPLYRDKGTTFLVYPRNFEGATPDERVALAARLRSLLARVEAGAEASNHR